MIGLLVRSLCSSAMFHPSSLARTTFTASSHAFNYCLYCNSHCKSYAHDHIAIGNLFKEIRSTHTFIPLFAHSELERIVSDAVSL